MAKPYVSSSAFSCQNLLHIVYIASGALVNCYDFKLSDLHFLNY